MAGEYIVSARKYRPDSFRTIVGQEAMASTLRTSVLTGKMAHAYLFCGPRGVGKTTAARVLAKTINCTDLSPEGEACNRCESCRAFNEQRSFNIFELDAASNNSVEDIRALTEQVGISPVLGKYKVYIIDEVHMLSSAAFNAFLKTLEEPPSYAIFILATTEKHKILPTILSRCQIFDFKRITVMDIVRHLRYVADSEGIIAEETALGLVAEKADGGMRDALSMFDRVASFSNGDISYESALECLNVLDHSHYIRLMESVLTGNYQQLLVDLDTILARGFDGQLIINGLSGFLRDLLVVQHPGTIQLLEKPDVVKELYLQLAQRCPVAHLYQAIKLLVQADQQYRSATNKRLLVELSMLNLLSLFSSTLNLPVGESSSVQPNLTISSSIQTQPTASTIPPRASVQTSVQSAHSVSAKPIEMISPTAVSSAPSSQLTEMSTSVSERSLGLVRSGRSSGGGSRLSGLLQQSQQEKKSSSIDSTNVSVEVVDEKKIFSENDLQLVWMRYVNEELAQEEVILRQIMQFNLPKLLGESLVEIGVPSETSRGELENIKLSVEQYLRRELRNSTISLQVRVLELQEQRFIPTTPEERFAVLKEANPAVAELRTKLNLRIS